MRRQTAIGTTLFLAGVLAGSILSQSIKPARADAVNWEIISREPGFREAVVDVINSCIVDNSIIYCN